MAGILAAPLITGNHSKTSAQRLQDLNPGQTRIDQAQVIIGEANSQLSRLWSQYKRQMSNPAVKNQFFQEAGQLYNESMTKLHYQGVTVAKLFENYKLVPNYSLFFLGSLPDTEINRVNAFINFTKEGYEPSEALKNLFRGFTTEQQISQKIPVFVINDPSFQLSGLYFREVTSDATIINKNRIDYFSSNLPAHISPDKHHLFKDVVVQNELTHHLFTKVIKANQFQPSANNFASWTYDGVGRLQAPINNREAFEFLSDAVSMNVEPEITLSNDKIGISGGYGFTGRFIIAAVNKFGVDIQKTMRQNPNSNIKEIFGDRYENFLNFIKTQMMQAGRSMLDHLRKQGLTIN